MTVSTEQVIPGEQILPSASNRRPGTGTYELHGKIYASLAGYVYIRQENKDTTTTEVIEVRRQEEKSEHVIPYVGGIVTARIENIGSRFAKCQLLCVDDSILTNDYNAILRREDIRANDKDKIDLQRCIQPGDIVLARVISFGDNQTSFLLSTAEDELGVIRAKGSNGENMIAENWETVKSADGLVREPRKLAQVPLLN